MKSADGWRCENVWTDSNITTEKTYIFQRSRLNFTPEQNQKEIPGDKGRLEAVEVVC
jgi:hypothetical protein